jgi:hypothetical protein
MFADEVIPFSGLVDGGGGGNGRKGVCTCYKKEGFVVSLGVFSSNSAQWTVWSKGRALFPCSMFNESCHR